MRMLMTEYLTPIKTEYRAISGIRLVFAWLGLAKKGPPTYTFADGTVFQPIPKGMEADWDAIRNGQRDVTGEYWKKYNKGKPAWNAVDWSRKVSEFKKMERLMQYDANLRYPIDSWPKAYRDAYRLTHK